METTTLHPVVMKLNFPFITRKPSFCGRTLIEGHNTELLHRYVLAMALELKANAADLADCEVQAIRLGGGSASIINGSDLDRRSGALENAAQGDTPPTASQIAARQKP